MGFDGPVSMQDLMLYPFNDISNPIKIDGIQLTSAILDDTDNDLTKKSFPYYHIGFDLAKGQDMTIYGYFRLLNKKMSRKKFKKWLISKGFNRDLAEWFCVAVKSFKGEQSYQSLYFNGLLSSTSQDLFNILFDTLFPINK